MADRPTRRLQPNPSATYRAEAEALFTRRAIDALPAAAIEALCVRAGEPGEAAACEAWAADWRVQTDGVCAWARGFVFLYRTLGWHTITDRADLRSCYHTQRGWADAEIRALAPALDRLRAWDARPLPPRLPLQRQTPDDDPLAPLSADPFVEDRQAFLARAASHWDARCAAINLDAAYADVTPAPELRQHVDWLVRFQIHGESWGAIARSVGRSVVAVTAGAKHVADAIGLTLRPAGKGGRPATARANR